MNDLGQNTPVHYVLRLVIEKTTFNRLEPVCCKAEQLFDFPQICNQTPHPGKSIRGQPEEQEAIKRQFGTLRARFDSC
jgi:hypothetical protein